MQGLLFSPYFLGLVVLRILPLSRGEGFNPPHPHFFHSFLHFIFSFHFFLYTYELVFWYVYFEANTSFLSIFADAYFRPFGAFGPQPPFDHDSAQFYLLEVYFLSPLCLLGPN